jgi:hypothetical protein
MSDKVVLGNGAVSRASARRRIPGAEISPTRPVESVDGTGSEDVRLIIEEPAPGQVVYVLVDRRTGKVLSRRTREDLKRLGEDPDYIPGSVFDAKA